MHHEPVLFSQISDIYTQISSRKYIIDATQGLGGHTQMLLEKAQHEAVILGIDRDADNLALASQKLGAIRSDITYRAVHKSFAHLGQICVDYEIPAIDFLLYDLGVSSAHYDDGERGFSFRYDAPLDMRFDRSQGQTAAQLLMTLSSASLQSILYEYGDEKKAPYIVEAIIQARATKPITTTKQLADIISAASFDKKSPLRVFQALRIALNQEFDHIRTSLEQAKTLMALGGIIAIITFHSSEDRLVKHFFAPLLVGKQDTITGQIIEPALFKKIYKKPIVPDSEEIQKNPRSRSAKLRVFKKIS